MTTPLRAISYNIRYDNPADGINAWSQRQGSVATLLQTQQPDLIGLQEVLHHQLTTLAAALPGYSWIGVGRDDGVQAGEYAPIFYRRERFALQASGHFWLSETPEQIGSFGWDAVCTRMATWALLQDITVNSSLLYLNTHFDHRGMTAQLESVKLLKQFLAEQVDRWPAIITGDFNCTPKSETYQALTSLSTDGTAILHDTMYQSDTPHEGPTASFTTHFADPLQEKIDYIFLHTGIQATHTFTVQRHAILADQTAGRYPSDHLPVMVKLTWAS